MGNKLVERIVKICRNATLVDDTHEDRVILHYRQNEVRFFNEKFLLGIAGFDAVSEGASITVMNPS